MKKLAREKVCLAFRNAIPFLASGYGGSMVPARYHNGFMYRTRYICFAISHGSPGGYGSACEIIQDRIYPHGTIEEWLEAQGIETGNFRKVQAYRHAWLRSLIKEFSV